MDELIINICRATFHDEPAKIKRCSVGLANYVFIVEIKGSKYTVRLNEYDKIEILKSSEYSSKKRNK